MGLLEDWDKVRSFNDGGWIVDLSTDLFLSELGDIINKNLTL
jgi:hypothetical protein